MDFYTGTFGDSGLTLTPKQEAGFSLGPPLTISFADVAKIETIIQMPEPDIVLLDLGDATGESRMVEGLTMADYKARLPGLAEVPTFMIAAHFLNCEQPITFYEPDSLLPSALEAALKDETGGMLDASDINSLINPSVVTAIDDRGLYRDVHVKDVFNGEIVCHTRLTVAELTARGFPPPRL